MSNPRAYEVSAQAEALRRDMPLYLGERVVGRLGLEYIAALLDLLAVMLEREEAEEDEK